MKKINLKVAIMLTCLFAVSFAAKSQISASFLGRYSTGGFYDNAAAEITAYDIATKRIFVINSPDSSLKIVNISNPNSPVLVSSVDIRPYGIDLTSVASKNGIVAITVIDSAGKTANGKVVFFNANGTYLNQVDVGANPDMLTFTPDGKKILVANEGEPNVGYTIDPEGSISIIDISNGVGSLTQANVQTATFTAFNSQTIDNRIKITGKIQTGTGTFLRNSTIAEDLEPEYVTISDDNATAWVTCQENNCLAEVDIASATVTRLIALGFKNHNLTGNGLDASDNGSTINIANYPVFGMYQPDAIASYKVGNTTYLVTANEGDARADWGAANQEDIRFGNAGYVVDTTKIGGSGSGVAALKANTALGRLNVSKFFGDNNNDGKFDSIFVFGARSFSVWNGTTGALVWDSKDEFEQRMAALFPTRFNVSSTNNTLKNRSDDKGPEPEAITVGKIFDSVYAFIGLERIGGVMIYNITDPNSPYFVQYINTRDFTVTPGAGTLSTIGDLGPEGILFVPRNESPNGKDMLIVSNEISGTVAMFQINSRSAYQMQILHSSDMESGLAAVTDAPNFAAVVDALEDRHVNTLILSSGDNILPGPFMSSGEDGSLQTPLRNTASSYYSGTQALRAAIGRPDIAIMNIIGYNASAMGNHEFDLGTSELNSQIGVDIRSNGADKRWIGAQFPFVTCNLNFSNDVNLSYLFTNQILRDTAFRTPAAITANTQKRGIAPSVIIERNGERIGIVGATTQVLAAISSPGATSVLGGPTDNMPLLASIIQPVVDSLVALGINKIVLLSHLQQIANEKALAPLLRNVDIIISGGNHAFTADGNDRLTPGHVATERYPIMTTNNNGQPLAILNTTSEWKYVGRFVCDFDTAGVLLPNLLDSVVNGAYVADTAMVTSLWGTYSAAFIAGTKGANVRTLCTAVGNVITLKDGNKFGKSNVFLEGRRNFVRTEETNLGNITSDANLWMARKYDNTVSISIKNGGGIRSAIGFVNAVGSNVILEPTQANPSAGKARGDISQLDIENSLRFNNRLSILSLTAANLKRIIEHGINATRPGATPGQFPQVGGIQFSYDTTFASGSKVRSLVVTDTAGNRTDTIVRDGMLVGDTNKVFKVVTLDFLAGGGDAYPFNTLGFNRINLDTAIKDTMSANFAIRGSEQDAFAEYMLALFNTNPYNVRDTSLLGDNRIQLRNARRDRIFPETNFPVVSINASRNVNPPSIVRVRGIVTRAWGRFIYIQDGTAGVGVRQSSGTMVDAILNGSLAQGDSVEVVGSRNNFNNYAQIQLATGNYNDSNRIIIIRRANALPVPFTATVSQVNGNGEFYESRLVEVKNLRTNSTGSFTASTNYTVWDGSNAGDTMLLRVISAQDSEVDDAPATAVPQGLFTFRGTVIQFCSSPTSGCTTGYQLQGVRKFEIIPQLTPFTLVSPANNTRLVTAAANTTPVNITWNRSLNAATYRWYIDVPAGNFNPGLASFASNNSGADTVLTLTNSAIDGLLASLGLAEGDSIETKWTVKSFLNGDSLLATSSFSLKLVRTKTMSAFNLLTPTNNTNLTVAQNSTTPVSITWSSAGANTYKWFLTSATGSFTNPLVVLPANASGTATALSLTSGAIDNVLAGLGIKKGETVNAKWTVYAYIGNDSLKAGQDFNINLTRQRTLTAFNLLTPANNTRLVTIEDDITPVNITWEASTGASQYLWLVDLPTGNFSNPLLSLPSNNGGSAATLTLTVGAIDSILALNAIAKGDSIELKWTVRAFEATVDQRDAALAFNIKFVRDNAVGIKEAAFANTFVMYPNPATGFVILSTTTKGTFDYELIDILGRSIATGNFENEVKIDLTSIEKGTYFIVIKKDGLQTTDKIIKN